MPSHCRDGGSSCHPIAVMGDHRAIPLQERRGRWRNLRGEMVATAAKRFTPKENHPPEGGRTQPRVARKRLVQLGLSPMARYPGWLGFNVITIARSVAVQPVPPRRLMAVQPVPHRRLVVSVPFK